MSNGTLYRSRELALMHKFSSHLPSMGPPPFKDGFTTTAIIKMKITFATGDNVRLHAFPFIAYLPPTRLLVACLAVTSRHTNFHADDCNLISTSKRVIEDENCYRCRSWCYGLMLLIKLYSTHTGDGAGRAMSSNRVIDSLPVKFY